MGKNAGPNLKKIVIFSASSLVLVFLIANLIFVGPLARAWEAREMTIAEATLPSVEEIQAKISTAASQAVIENDVSACDNLSASEKYVGWSYGDERMGVQEKWKDILHSQSQVECYRDVAEAGDVNGCIALQDYYSDSIYESTRRQTEGSITSCFTNIATMNGDISICDILWPGEIVPNNVMECRAISTKDISFCLTDGKYQAKETNACLMRVALKYRRVDVCGVITEQTAGATWKEARNSCVYELLGWSYHREDQVCPYWTPVPGGEYSEKIMIDYGPDCLSRPETL